MLTATLAPPRRQLLPLLIPVGALLAVGDLSGWFDPPTILGGFFRPLTTLLLLLHAAGLPSDDSRRRRWVLLGLGASVAADCLVALPGGYTAGLFVFALAMACYVTATGAWAAIARPGVAHAAHAVVVAALIAMWSKGPMAAWLAIALFLILLGLLAAHADTWWWRSRGTAAEPLARRAALAGLLWLGADSLWTYSNHVSWVPGTFAAVLVLYWLAQWHLASMVRQAA